MLQGLAGPSALVDSNILVYVVDPRDLTKRAQAVDLLNHLTELQAGALSAQSLSEFFANAIRLPDPLTRSAAAAQVERFAETFPVLDITARAVREACHRAAASQIAIWDALIWSVAETNGIPLILTEDMPGGRNAISGVRYANPFAVGFQLARVLPGG